MKALKKLSCVTLAVCMLAALLPAGRAIAAGEAFPEAYTIYPKPQSIAYGDGGAVISDVNLVVSETADAPTVSRIEGILAKSAVSFERSQEVVGGKTNITLGIVGDGSAASAYFNSLALADTSALLQPDGYVISVLGGNVAILGSDAVSLFYGAVTFEQILAEGVNVRSMLINDFSDTVNRGTIEGFYGIPWSFEGRKAVIEMSGKYKMNQYIYAPKDDPYHHGDMWRDPYPEEDLADLKVLVDTANNNNISFIWAVHVNDTFDFTDEDDAANAALPVGGTHSGSGGQWYENDRGKLVPPGQHEVDEFEAEETYQSVVAKFEQLYSIGVRQFGFFADDINFPLARFHAPDMVKFTNRLNAEWIQGKGDVKPLIFCPTYYHRADIVFNGRPYMAEITKLDPTIEVMYTGQHVMSNIQAGTAGSYNNYFINLMEGRKPLIWWNYPVTDYVPQLVLLGPTPGLNPDAKGTMTGAVSNPMQQSFASHISLFGLADFLWNTAGYDRDANWEDSFERLYPEVADSLKLIATHAISGYNTTAMEGLSGKESAYLIPFMDNFEAAIKNTEGNIGIGAAGEALAAEFTRLVDAAADFRANCVSDGLKDDLKPWVDKLESLARTGINIIKAYQSLDNIEEAWNAYSEATLEIAGWPGITVPMLEGGSVSAEIGSVALTGNIREWVGLLESALNDSQSRDQLTKENTMITNIAGLTAKPVVVTDVVNFGAFGIANNSLSAKRYIGLKLDDVYKTAGVKVTYSGIENSESAMAAIALQYSVNGVEWNKAETVNEPGTLSVNTNNTGARYFRVINTGDTEIAMNIESFEVTVTGGSKLSPAAVTSTAGIYQTNRATNLFDGNYASPYWTNGSQVPGQEVVAEFAEPFELRDFALYEANSDYIRGGSIYASVDGENWTKVASLGTNFIPESIDGAEYYVIRGNGNGIQTKYIRITTESAANVWTKLHEFVFNQTTGEQDGTEPAFNAILDGIPANLIDGDFSTTFTTTSDEPYLNYRLSENANAVLLSVLQNSQNISDAKVLIRTFTGDAWEFVEVGALSEAYNEFDLQDYPYGISDIRFEWVDNGVVPRLHELYTETDIGLPELTALVDEASSLPVGSNTYAYQRLTGALDYADAVMSDKLATLADADAAYDGVAFWAAGINDELIIRPASDEAEADVLITNYTDSDISANLIFAVYDDRGALVSYETKTVSCPGGEMTYEAFETRYDANNSVFAWDTTTFAPFGKFIVI